MGRIKIVLAALCMSLPVCSFAQVSLQPFSASPDQVLVLYNADYTIDVDGSAPGQDSKEVADYYVKMHTDKITGKSPHILGLKCVHHGKEHLNSWYIREESDDNKNGIIYTGVGKSPKQGEWIRDSRYVEINLNSKEGNIDWDSVELWCQSEGTDNKKKVFPEVSGIPTKGRNKIYPPISEGKGRCYRLNANAVFKGNVLIFFKAKDRAGKLVRNLKLNYYDRDDFVFSQNGADGIADDKNFQEDVAIPVKAFLENPENALSDGTLLKEHILYIVVCHGMPFACDGVFGIEKGATDKQGDHGDRSSLEQRLQTLYYGWGTTIVPPVTTMAMRAGPDAKLGVKNYRITSAMRQPLWGRRWNPYMHPDTYASFKPKWKARYVDIPPFPEVRKKMPKAVFAYAVCRIDGQGPAEAKRIIDYSLYASKYLRPEMDASVRDRPEEKKTGDIVQGLKNAEKKNRWGTEEVITLGFKSISKYNKDGIPFLKRPDSDYYQFKQSSANPKDKTYRGYYPGGMDRGVVSSNGWNMARNQPIWRQVDQGVTVSACGSPAHGGGPHITKATFWDNRILMRYLFRGRDLGESFLLSTYYVNWSTSLLGDPLYHPDLTKTVVDRKRPSIRSKNEVNVKLVPAMGKYAGSITVPVLSSKEHPEVARLVLYYSKEGDTVEQVSRWPVYSTRPHVVLRNLEPESTYKYRLVLIDPYGNRADLAEGLGMFSFKTGPEKIKTIEKYPAKKKKKYWEIDLFKTSKFKEQGTIEVEFIAGDQGCGPVVYSDGFSVGLVVSKKGSVVQGTLTPGGHRLSTWGKSPLKTGEKALLAVRWRRFPLTRECVLRSADGSEFTLVKDVRTPWKSMELKEGIKIKTKNGVQILSGRIFNDAYPASFEACGL